MPGEGIGEREENQTRTLQEVEARGLAVFSPDETSRDEIIQR